MPILPIFYYLIIILSFCLWDVVFFSRYSLFSANKTRRQRYVLMWSPCVANSSEVTVSFDSQKQGSKQGLRNTSFLPEIPFALPLHTSLLISKYSSYTFYSYFSLSTTAQILNLFYSYFYWTRNLSHMACQVYFSKGKLLWKDCYPNSFEMHRDSLGVIFFPFLWCVRKKSKKTLWPLFMDGVQLPQG